MNVTLISDRMLHRLVTVGTGASRLLQLRNEPDGDAQAMKDLEYGLAMEMLDLGMEPLRRVPKGVAFGG